MKEYTSNIVVTFSINNLQAESKEDYIEKIKDQFNELHGIELMNHEIKNIEESEADQNEYVDDWNCRECGMSNISQHYDSCPDCDSPYDDQNN